MMESKMHNRDAKYTGQALFFTLLGGAIAQIDVNALAANDEQLERSTVVAEFLHASRRASWVVGRHYSQNTMGIAQCECRSVLLVEDNEVDAYLTYNVLQESEPKIAVEIASTAEEGLTRAAGI